MKKELLTLVSVFLLVFFGTMIGVKASDSNATSRKRVGNLNFKANKSVQIIKLNVRYAELRKECKSKFGPICDAAINTADQASQLAWSVCGNPNFSTAQCYAYQEWALNIFDEAMAICQLESLLDYHVANLIHKRKNELINKRKDDLPNGDSFKADNGFSVTK